MSKKQVIRSVTFICIFLFIIVQLCDLFEDKNSYITARYHKYNTLAEDTVDAAIIGTSGFDRYWIAAKAYEEYGMTVYPLTTDAQPSWLMLNMVKEAEKQSPELIILDMRPFLVVQNGENPTYKARCRHITDMLGFFSANRWDALSRSMKVFNYLDPEGDHDELSYYLPFIKFHSKWEESSFSFEEMEDVPSSYLGFFMHKTNSLKVRTDVELTVMTEDRVELSELSLAVLDELLDYVEDKDYEVLFASTPNQLTKNEIGRLNSLCDILDERGVKYVDMTVADSIGLDVDTDFYNHGHVNYQGAEKFTTYFSAWLDENYDLPDRRNDEAVKKDWDGIYEKIQKKIAKWSEK